MPSTLDEQLTKYLTEVHSIEAQALAQLRAAPKIAGDEELARVFSEHLEETEEQERRVRERLEARDASTSKLPSSRAPSASRRRRWPSGWPTTSTAPWKRRSATSRRTTSRSSS